jgi:hypothetical protein
MGIGMLAILILSALLSFMASAAFTIWVMAKHYDHKH